MSFIPLSPLHKLFLRLATLTEISPCAFDMLLSGKTLNPCPFCSKWDNMYIDLDILHCEMAVNECKINVKWICLSARAEDLLVILDYIVFEPDDLAAGQPMAKCFNQPGRCYYQSGPGLEDVPRLQKRLLICSIPLEPLEHLRISKRFKSLVCFIILRKTK